jgi:hypothetical protein
MCRAHVRALSGIKRKPSQNTRRGPVKTASCIGIQVTAKFMICPRRYCSNMNLRPSHNVCAVCTRLVTRPKMMDRVRLLIRKEAAFGFTESVLQSKSREEPLPVRTIRRTLSRRWFVSCASSHKKAGIGRDKEPDKARHRPRRGLILAFILSATPFLRAEGYTSPRAQRSCVCALWS